MSLEVVFGPRTERAEDSVAHASTAVSLTRLDGETWLRCACANPLSDPEAVAHALNLGAEALNAFGR